MAKAPKQDTIQVKDITNKMQIVRQRKWVDVQRVYFHFPSTKGISLHLANGEIVNHQPNVWLTIRYRMADLTTYTSQRTSVVTEDDGFYR